LLGRDVEYAPAREAAAPGEEEPQRAMALGGAAGRAQRLGARAGAVGEAQCRAPQIGSTPGTPRVRMSVRRTRLSRIGLRLALSAERAG